MTKPQTPRKAFYPKSFRLTATGNRLLSKLAESRGLSLSGWIEMTVRDVARSEGIAIEESESDQPVRREA